MGLLIQGREVGLESLLMRMVLEIVRMRQMVLLMVGLSGWGFLSWAGLLLGLGQQRRGPDIATR